MRTRFFLLLLTGLALGFTHGCGDDDAPLDAAVPEDAEVDAEVDAQVPPEPVSTAHCTYGLFRESCGSS